MDEPGVREIARAAGLVGGAVHGFAVIIHAGGVAAVHVAGVDAAEFVRHDVDAVREGHADTVALAAVDGDHDDRAVLPLADRSPGADAAFELGGLGLDHVDDQRGAEADGVAQAEVLAVIEIIEADPHMVVAVKAGDRAIGLLAEVDAAAVGDAVGGGQPFPPPASMKPPALMPATASYCSAMASRVRP